MPTPTHFFHDIAARYGNVDPGDPEAVRHWFTEVLPTLPPETIEEILEVAPEGRDTTDDKTDRAELPARVCHCLRCPRARPHPFRFSPVDGETS